MSTSTDIEELEGKLERVTLRTRAMEEAPLGITIADMTAADEPLVYANEGFERITGYDTDKVLDRNCRFLQGEGTEPEPVAKIREAIEAGESTRVTLKNYRKDGGCFWNEVTLAPLPEGDEIPYYVGFQQDVTLRKEYEKQLETQRDDLDVLSQMVRHDVRNDLQLVLSSLELLEEFVTEDGYEHLKTALDSTRQAIELTFTASDMTDTVMANDGEYEAIPLQETLCEQTEKANAMDNTATVTVEGTIPRVDVRANEMLESVFRNLLSNAIQHNDKAEPKVNVSAVIRDGEVEVAVADNGPGIPDDQKERMFGKGVRGEESGNTGIGLYLVDRLVKNYDGDVWVDDRDDVDGSVFFVQLPLAE